MKRKLVSVCIPVYNGARTIAGTLESVLGQTYKNMEIIIVDNHSQDHTIEIVKKYKDDRIRIYRNDENLGLAGNLNQCLKYARGSYIQYVCADDILYPECISRKVWMMEKDERISIVFSASEVIGDTGKVLMTRRPYKKSCIVDGTGLAGKSYLEKNLFGEPSNVLFRAQLLEQTGKFSADLCYTIDWDMWLRLSCTGLAGYVDDVLMQYRISRENVTSSIRFRALLEDDRTMMEKVRSGGYLKTGWMADAVHHMVFMLRALARMLYMRIRCRGGVS